jgi:glycosyltransferase involved in cell wall biosynthesis
MRLLFLSDRVSTRGGADHHLRDLIEALADEHTITWAHGSVEPGLALPPGVEGVRVKGLSSAVASERQLQRLDPLLQRADLVHAQNVVNPLALQRVTARRPTVVTVQDHRFFCPGRGKWTPDDRVCHEPMGRAPCHDCFADEDYGRRTTALTEARRRSLEGLELIVLSRYMAAELAAVGLPGATVIPPWVEPGEKPTPGTGLLLAGRLVAHKGVLDAWRAWRLSGTDQPLCVAGEGPLAHRLTGAERLGWLPRPDFRRQLRRARALLLPCGWQEPFGIVGLEALAMGTPVVVADSGGTGDWSAEGCVHVARGDRAAMARAIARLGSDAAEARALGEAGQAAVARRFARGPLLQRVLEIYRRLLTRRSTGD